MQITKEQIRDKFLKGEDITQLDVSHLTDMSELFKDLKDFNQPIGSWNTSNVTDMSVMFGGCQSFNQDISSWDTSKVTDMNCMFYGCKEFNSNITKWNTTNVTDMCSMFKGCKNFNQDISSWNLSNVKIFENWFEDCELLDSLNIDLLIFTPDEDTNVLFGGTKYENSEFLYHQIKNGSLNLEAFKKRFKLDSLNQSEQYRLIKFFYSCNTPS